MSEQQFQNIVLELDIKIDRPEDLPDGLSLGKSKLVAPSMLNTSLVHYLADWRQQKRLLPESGNNQGSTYVFREPTALDELPLVGTAFLGTRVLFDHLAEHLHASEIGHLSDLVQCEAIVIEHLGFGCVKARIKYYLKVAGVVVTLLGAIGGAVGGAVAYKTYLDPPAPAIEASCTVHMKDPQDLGRELRRTIERYPYTWMASGNEACVRLRQQVLNQFLDSPIKDDGFYGGDTVKAEEAVARKVGLDSAKAEELYPFLTDRLEEPQSILVFNIPRR